MSRSGLSDPFQATLERTQNRHRIPDLLMFCPLRFPHKTTAVTSACARGDLKEKGRPRAHEFEHLALLVLFGGGNGTLRGHRLAGGSHHGVRFEGFYTYHMSFLLALSASCVCVEM